MIYAYCLMGNYYYLLLSTPRANLSRAIRHINDLYTQQPTIVCEEQMAHFSVGDTRQS
jgi:hypothetical protein